MKQPTGGLQDNSIFLFREEEEKPIQTRTSKS